MPYVSTRIALLAFDELTDENWAIAGKLLDESWKTVTPAGSGAG